MFCLKGDHPLVNQEYFRQSIVGGLDGSATFYNRTYLEFHRWIGGCRCEFRAIADFAIYLIARLVCTRWEDGALIVDTTHMDRGEVPDALMREMRSSVIFLGAILARCGMAKLSYPGGCELGPRPIDLHLSALRTLGATWSPLWALGSLDVGTLGHEVDGMLALQSLNGGHRLLIDLR